MPRNKKKLVFLIPVLVVVLAAGYFFIFARPVKIKTEPQTQTQTQTQTGTVTGRLCYPSEGLPKGKIVAKNVQTGETIIQDYPGSGATSILDYSFELPPAGYYLRYDVAGPEGDLMSNFYTNYSDCALTDTCGERKSPQQLLPVKVEAGKTIKNIHLCDFIYPANKIDF